MKLSPEILNEIKRLVHKNEPDAKIILYGSYARGDANEESDIDLLILLGKESVDYEDQKRIAYPLYDFGIKTDQIISALIKSKKNWDERYFYTPLFHNIKKEGIEI